MASYGFGNFMNEYLAMAFGTYAFYFYERELGLNVMLVDLGFFIFAVYNVINDPLVEAIKFLITFTIIFL